MPQLWQDGAAFSLMASHSLHSFRFNREPHSWQNLLPRGLAWSQERHCITDMAWTSLGAIMERRDIVCGD